MKYFITILFVVYSCLLFGGPGPGDSIPIDGGLSYLLVAGAAYGGYKLIKRGKEEKGEEK